MVRWNPAQGRNYDVGLVKVEKRPQIDEARKSGPEDSSAHHWLHDDLWLSSRRFSMVPHQGRLFRHCDLAADTEPISEENNVSIESS
jgi:hypothetical protein